MTGIVVDTDVVSFLFKSDSRAVHYLPHLQGVVPVISFQTVAELYLWTLRRNWGAVRIAELDRQLAQFAVHPGDQELCRRWAAVRDQCARVGPPIGTADAWQAATALYLGVPLV